MLKEKTTDAGYNITQIQRIFSQLERTVIILKTGTCIKSICIDCTSVDNVFVSNSVQSTFSGDFMHEIYNVNISTIFLLVI